MACLRFLSCALSAACEQEIFNAIDSSKKQQSKNDVKLVSAGTLAVLAKLECVEKRGMDAQKEIKLVVRDIQVCCSSHPSQC